MLVTHAGRLRVSHTRVAYRRGSRNGLTGGDGGGDGGGAGHGALCATYIVLTVVPLGMLLALGMRMQEMEDE